MRITVVTGSRADWGPLEWLVKTLREDAFFEVDLKDVRKMDLPCTIMNIRYEPRPDIVLVLGDRYEILACVIAAHLQRIPIAHIGGGDVTEGSYDDAMRDCISRMATLHFVTSVESQHTLQYSLWHIAGKNIHLVGSPGVDYIMHADWKRERPIAEPYVVVSYQTETIDGTNEIESVLHSLPQGKHKCLIMPNSDRGSAEIELDIVQYWKHTKDSTIYSSLSHGEFLNLLHHCDEFIGNSSSMFYEAPFMGVKTLVIGKRQRGRVMPWGDGKASERIVEILMAWHTHTSLPKPA